MNPTPLTAVPTAKSTDALAELSALRLQLPLIHDPRLRMKASLRLLTAWNAVGLPTRHLRAELQETMQRAIPQHLARALFQSRIESILARPEGPELAVHLFEFGQQTPSYGLVRLLTQRGFIALAQEYATLLGGTQRERSVYLSNRGIEGWGRHKRFIGRVDDVERYPISRTLVVGCLQQLSEQANPHPALVAAVEARMWTLEGADLQEALAMRPLVAWQVGGEAAAWRAWRSIRYKSRRLQALERLVAKARSVGAERAAERFLRALPPHRHSRCALPPGRGPAKIIWTAALLHELARTLRARLDPSSEETVSGPARAQLLKACEEEEVCAELVHTLGLEGDVGTLTRLKALLGPFGADALHAGWLRNRQAALLAISADAATALTRTRHGAAESDVRSLARARYDEALALQADGHARRRVLARAVKATLTLALREPESVSEATLLVRLRTLSHLGDGIAANVLRPLLGRIPPLWSPRALRLVVTLSTTGAAAPPDFPTLPAALLAHTVERRCFQGRLPAGTAVAWRALARVVRERLGEEQAARWLREVLSLHRPFPSPELLREVLMEVNHRSGSTLAPYAQLLSETLAEVAGLDQLTPADLLARLADRPMLVSRLRRHQPPLLAAGAVAWSSTIWSELLRAAPEVGEVTRAPVATFAAAIPDGEAVAERLLEGQCPAVDAVWPIAEQKRLRLLDKRQDLFTFLRFPDSAACCWQSRRGYSNPVRERILSLWMDPLSFCFLVESGTQGGQWSPVGFVFGSFGLSQGQPIMLLNGLYLRQKSPALRTDTLKQLERFGRSLGLRWLVIANRHGGSGAMPTSYQLRSRPFQRLRALTKQGVLVSRTVDDIGERLNCVVVASHLYWKPLLDPVGQPLE